MAAASTVGRDLHAVTLCRPEVGHRLLVVGYLRGPRPDGLDCQRPLRVVCRDCDHRTAWACAGHRESACKPCATRYRTRVRTVAASGLRRSAGFLYFLTLTAPGAEAHCLRAGCSGAGDGLGCRHPRCPCTPVGGVDLAEWNTSHSARWNRLRTALRRDYPGLQFFRGVEVQNRRPALHDHAMVWSPTPLHVGDLPGLPGLRSRAISAGFGHSLDCPPVDPGSRKAAYYVSKYVTKATDLRESVPWIGETVDTRTGEVTRGLVPGRYRTWSMSRGWGSTMAEVRQAAAGYARLKEDEKQDESLGAALRALRASLGTLTWVPPEGADPPWQL